MGNQSFYDYLFQSLPQIHRFHMPACPTYQVMAIAARREIEKSFDENTECKASFGPFGELHFPYHKMGTINSLDLFGLDELILFSFYWQNQCRYNRVADIGGNIGIHTVLLLRAGFDVRTFEPDPIHMAHIQTNLILNECNTGSLYKAAVSDHDGMADFVRVLGNTTGSHLAGAKDSPYGDLERFEVEVVDIRPIIEWADFMKIDAEGHEAQMLAATNSYDWQNTDAMVEVGTVKNADFIFNHLNDLGVNMFSQKTGWSQVSNRAQMPKSYKEGTLFITSKSEICWE